MKRREDAGEIVWWKFEGVTLKLADRTTYTPDFVVMLADGTLEMHEVKAGKRKAKGSEEVTPLFQNEGGKIKIKIAAAQFPFRFVIVFDAPKALGGNWHYLEV